MTKATKTKLDEFENASLNAGYMRNEGLEVEADEAEARLNNARIKLVKRIEKLERDAREYRIIQEFV
jgi:hypothetical protein